MCGNAGASGPSAVRKDQIAERGARLARRDNREYSESLLSKLAHEKRD